MVWLTLENGEPVALPYPSGAPAPDWGEDRPGALSLGDLLGSCLFGARVGNRWRNSHVKRKLAVLTCTIAMVAGLTACGGEESRETLTRDTGASSPSATSTTSSPTTAAPTETGPIALVEHSTHTNGGLKLVVNFPADIPAASRPSMRVFSQFLQAAGRTNARNKVDPTMSRLASAGVLKETQDSVTPGSVEGIGSLIFTVSKVQTGTSGFAVGSC